jgi:hypothetical protein
MIKLRILIEILDLYTKEYSSSPPNRVSVFCSFPAEAVLPINPWFLFSVDMKTNIGIQ